MAIQCTDRGHADYELQMQKEQALPEPNIPGDIRNRRNFPAIPQVNNVILFQRAPNRPYDIPFTIQPNPLPNRRQGAHALENNRGAWPPNTMTKIQDNVLPQRDSDQGHLELAMDSLTDILTSRK